MQEVEVDFPAMTITCPPEQAVDRLEQAAKRGQLPGFSRGGSDHLFEVDAYGAVFEYGLRAKASNVAGRTTLAFSLVLRRKVPAIMAVVFVLSIWPGLPMTDSMLRTWSTWYDGLPSWTTLGWYLPLTIVPLPWMWLSWHRASRLAANKQAKVQLETIGTVLRDAIAA